MPARSLRDPCAGVGQRQEPLRRKVHLQRLQAGVSRGELGHAGDAGRSDRTAVAQQPGAGQLQVAHACVKDLAGLKIQRPAFSSSGRCAGEAGEDGAATKLTEFTAAGGWVVCLEQEQFPTDASQSISARTRPSGAVERPWYSPSTPGIRCSKALAAKTFAIGGETIYVTRLNLIKPTEGNFRPVLAYGNATTPSADRTPLVEVFHGRGGYVVSQMLLVEKFDSEPVASRLLANILNYARRRQLQDAESLSPKLALFGAGRRGGQEGLAGGPGAGWSPSRR